ncbi:MMPL family transporter [Embleya sp. NPDC008237]|uniref:MMPL family transporter n=1 Tax=Embleya sp. NPDC008237 TaxID=3363978 RepID=UPI0036ED0602
MEPPKPPKPPGRAGPAPRVPSARLGPRPIAVTVLLLTLVFVGAVFALGPSEANTPGADGANLPASSQSAKAAKIVDGPTGGGRTPVLVVYSRADGSALTEADRAVIGGRAAPLGAVGLDGVPAEAVFDPKGTVATVPVPVSDKLEGKDNDRLVATVRKVASDGVHRPLRVQVTGGPAVSADLTKVFDGADVTLLVVTALVVAVLLLVTYRSPVLWLVPLVVVAIGDRLATVVVGALAPKVDVAVDSSAAGILSVLVFGAGTNYALLLVSRYRDELRSEEDRFAAMRRALRGVVPAVLASGSTVVLSLLTLLAAELTVNRGLGFAGACGIVIAMFFGLVVLPAALVLPGRWLFWPLIPRVGDPIAADRDGVWAKLGRVVSARPVLVSVGATAVLGALACGLFGTSVGLSQNEIFRKTPESVQGAKTLQSVRPAGATQPLTVVSSAPTGAAVAKTAEGVEGVSSVEPGATFGRYAVTDVILDSTPGSSRSDATLVRLRRALADVPDAHALVGGTTAGEYDVARATDRDTRIVVPLVLAIVFGVLVLLLRALVAPALLVLTVVATYFSALGAAEMVFGTVYDFPALDDNVPLLSFLFLVALGVDYNIFLIARAREDTVAGHDTRAAILRALASTGGVITSAGILLAAVFAVLGVLPLITLTQIGVIVGAGVLLDTLVVRTVLVPALVLLTGKHFWWPGRPEGAGDGGGAGTGGSAKPRESAASGAKRPARNAG